MKKVVRLTESDLTRIVKRVLMESNGVDECLRKYNIKVDELPLSCKENYDKEKCKLDLLKKGKKKEVEDLINKIEDCRSKN